MSKKMIDSLLEHRSCLLCRYRTYTLRLRRDCIQNLCNHCGLDKPVHISQCLLQDRRIFLTTQTNPQWNSHPEKYHKENSLQLFIYSRSRISALECNSRENTNYKREYYLPSTTDQVNPKTTNARAKKIFILKYRVDRLFK